MRRLLLTACLLLAAVPVVVGAQRPAAADAPFTAGGSVNQVYAYDVGAGVQVELLDATDAVVDSGPADSAGAKLFREVPTGVGYQVRTAAGTVSDLTVTGPDDHPDESFYIDQATTDPLEEGYGYLTTRDGTKLSVNVTFPIGPEAGPPPWPVVVNYSGYDPSKPGAATREVAVYPLQGYVTVGVNMRGTGCSGGTFEFMETLQSTDGYDAIETIAQQPWADGNVGMVGISYSGYSQLYVGATNPPHLDAIAPASPYSDTYSAILYPGGILNDGFAVDWATERENGAKPAARAWARDRIAGGDAQCAENQLLRLQAKPLLERIQEMPYADHEFDYLNTETFVDQIQMPTFISSQWQDEQTGGSAANLVPLFDPDTKVYGNFTNGTHVEPMSPDEIYEQMVFVDLYVAKRVPRTASLLTLGAGSVLSGIFRSDDAAAFALPVNTWTESYDDHASALAAYEAQLPIRLRWENGGMPGLEGLPFTDVITRHAAWPDPGLTAEKLYLQPDGALAPTPADVADSVARAASAYVYDPSTKRPSTSTEGTESLWAAHPDVQWDVLAEGNSLSFLSAPYTEQVAYAGQGSVDLWLRSSAADTDLEATLTEVRPDGQENYIQSGWLRASHRTLEEDRSTELVPYHDHQEEDASPLPAGEFTPVRLELFPFAHLMRPGSQLRVNIEAPGGNQPFWKFDTIAGTATNEIGHSETMASRVVLPRLPEVPANMSAERATCSLEGITSQAVSLRNQPCRPYQPARVASGVSATAQGDDVVVSWSPPPGDSPTGYRVHAALGAGSPDGAVAPDPVEVDGATTTATFAAPAAGVPFEFTVEALYGADTAPRSNASLPVEVTPLALRLFGDWTAFVTRQLEDHTDAAPGAAVAEGVAAIEGGLSPEAYIASLRDGSDAVVNVDPVTRLYVSYFRRVPDFSGQGYWVRQRRGGRTLIRTSNTFAASSEFQSIYGSLSNRAFVELVYRNVLGREGDAAGIDYWTRQLDLGRKSRGQVMLNFSESSEFIRTSAAYVDVINVWLSMLGRPPSNAEIDGAVARLGNGEELAAIIAEVLATEDYAARVGS